MYQSAVKLRLLNHLFEIHSDLEATVDIDGMELKGGNHKQQIGVICKAKLQNLSLTKPLQINSTHPSYTNNKKRPDIFAFSKKSNRTYIIECEGKGSLQMNMKMYSALSQVVINTKSTITSNEIYGIAVPDKQDYIKQLRKIPQHIRELLNIHFFLINRSGVTIIKPNQTF
nr:hypothetical protein [Paenibacillus xylanexedens]